MSRDLPPDGAEIIESALRDAFVMDAPMGGQMGVVEMIQSMAQAQKGIADAICKPGAPYIGEDGGHVSDLTEAMIMCGKGLHSIAEAIEGLAEAARDRNEFLREQAEGES